MAVDFRPVCGCPSVLGTGESNDVLHFSRPETPANKAGVLGSGPSRLTGYELSHSDGAAFQRKSCGVQFAQKNNPEHSTQGQGVGCPDFTRIRAAVVRCQFCQFCGNGSGRYPKNPDKIQEMGNR